MLDWLDEHKSTIIAFFVCVGFMFYAYGCEPEVRSVIDDRRMVNRAELQYELNLTLELVELRMLDLDKQEELRAIILQNALILVGGQPFNPIGIITAFAAIYGVASGSQNISRVVRDKRDKKRGNNG